MFPRQDGILGRLGSGRRAAGAGPFPCPWLEESAVNHPLQLPTSWVRSVTLCCLAACVWGASTSGCATGTNPEFGGAGGTGATSTHATGGSTHATTGASMTSSTSSGGLCGNNVCDASETCQSCPGDCTCGGCGDGVCQASESCTTCPDDCKTNCSACNMNGICDAGENSANCPSDCPATTGTMMTGFCNDPCTPGPAQDLNACSMDPTFGPCVEDVCSSDAHCCMTAWDQACIDDVNNSFVCLFFFGGC
jgi:hypothetical protein